MRTTIDENLTWIAETWHHLIESRIKGTPLPWRQPTLTPEQQTELDAQARAEKTEHGAFVLGESPSPLHLDALDKAIHIAGRIQQLARLIALELGHYALATKLTRTTYHEPEALITYIRHHHTQLPDPEGLTLEVEVQRIRRILAHHFSDITDGQRLKTDCPWCNQPKLFIRLIGPDNNPEPVVTCESRQCEPPSADCGKYWKGNPAWPPAEWDWLANRMNHHEHATKTQTG